MSEVIPKMPRCNLHSHYYPTGGFCHYCLSEPSETESTLQDALPVKSSPQRQVGGKNAHATVKFTVNLKLVSMKNRKIQTRAGHVFKNPDVKAFEEDFAMLIPSEYRHLMLGSLTEPLAATIQVWYPSRRSDLDVALVLDCLQTSGVISNDRHVIEQHLYARIDRDNPRIEIELRVLDL